MRVCRLSCRSWAVYAKHQLLIRSIVASPLVLYGSLVSTLTFTSAVLLRALLSWLTY